MGTEVTSPFGSALSMENIEALADAMDQSAGLDPRGGAPDGSQYMNFSGKRGVYEMGKDKTDADEEELFVVNITAFEDGFVCWKGGRPLAKRFSPMGRALPVIDREEHGPFGQGEGWQQAKTMTLRSLDTGVQYYFTNNSVSGVSEFASLQKECTARIRSKAAAWPVISLGKFRFQAQGNWNYKPIFNIDGWLDIAGITAVAEALQNDTEVDLAALYKGGGAPTGGAKVTKAAEPKEEPKPEPVVARRRRTV